MLISVRVRRFEMQATLTVLFISTASLAFAEGLPRAEPRQAGFSEERLQRIHQVLKSSVERKEFAGINVAIMRRGKLAYFEDSAFRTWTPGNRCSRTPFSAWHP